MRIELSIPMSLREIAAALNSPIPNENALISFITTDTREICKGDLFFAIKGEKHDGESFVSEAQSLGAYTVSRSGSTIKVKNGEDALLLLSSYYRSKLKKLRRIIAVTGSVGKTTTKDVLFQIIKRVYPTHATEKNYNNALGVAFTVLGTPSNTEILLLEMGMNHFGELSKIVEQLPPDLAIITNIKDAHIGNFGSLENIAKAKLEIAKNEKTHLILPFDEPLFSKIELKSTVSLESPEADVYISTLKEEQKSTTVDIFTAKSCISSVKINLVGHGYLEAVAYAAAVADALDVKDLSLKEGIESLSEDTFRKRKYELYGYHIVDDCYSSSPSAMLYELELAAKSHPCSSVIGDMLELGEYAIEKHRKIGEAAYKLGYRRIYAFGKFAREVAQGAITAGMSEDRIHVNTDLSCPRKTAEALFLNSIDGETILFKGSHATMTERVIVHFENLLKRDREVMKNA